ncbi:MAG: Rpn family recombination-promoting nuclease/putative transposase [Lachnospiraceae bacterium]
MDKTRKKKKFQELELCDAFLFAATMEDEDICRKVLERILEIPISHVKVRSENPIAINPDYRSIRLDVYAADEEGTLYDVEMETAGKRRQLPKRTRFYQSQMDIATLKPGESFQQLPKSYVIFICTFDPFEEGLFRYSFENRCLETDLELGDETRKIFLNTKGIKKQNVSEELLHFLRFIENSKAVTTYDPLLAQLQDRMSQLKNNQGLEGNYMLFGELLDDERQDGIEEGIEEGIEKGSKRD